MTFDRVITNPPYNGSLHLQIIEEARRHLSDGGELVTLSPIRFLEETFVDYKFETKPSDYRKYEFSVLKGMDSMEVITATEANGYFPGADFYIDLGIYKVLKTNTGTYPYADIKYRNCPRSIFNKVIKQSVGFIGEHLVDRGADPCVKCPGIHGHAGKDDWYEVVSPVKEVTRSSECTGLGMSWVNFNTEEEAENFRMYLMSPFITWFVGATRTSFNLFWNNIPWMPSYKEPWTMERINEFYGFTEEEQELMKTRRCFCK